MSSCTLMYKQSGNNEQHIYTLYYNGYRVIGLSIVLANKLIYCLADQIGFVCVSCWLLQITYLTELNSPGCLAYNSEHDHVTWKCHNSVSWNYHILWKYHVSSCGNAKSHFTILHTKYCMLPHVQVTRFYDFDPVSTLMYTYMCIYKYTCTTRFLEKYSNCN